MWNPGSPHEPLTVVILAGFARKGAADFGARIVAGTMPECCGDKHPTDSRFNKDS
jgi:hypothetical protein